MRRAPQYLISRQYDVCSVFWSWAIVTSLILDEKRYAWQRPNHIDFCKRVGRRSPCCRAQSKAVGPWDRVSQLNRPYENGTIWPTRIDTVGDQMLQGMTDRLASGGC